MVRNKWNKDNIKVILNIPKDEKNFNGVTNKWNKEISKLIMNKINVFPEEQKNLVLEIVQDKLMKHNGDKK